MIRPRVALTTLTLLVATVGLVACGPTEPPSQARNDAGDLIPHSDLQDAQAFSWREIEIVNDTSLRVRFGSGTPVPCSRTNVEIIEDAETVQITTFMGKTVNADRDCPGPYITKLDSYPETIAVELTSPLGERTVVDGYTDEMRVPGDQGINDE